MAGYQFKSAAYSLKLLEVKKLFYAASLFRNRCILKLLFQAGLRRQELTRLDVRDIDFERRRIQVRGKGGKIRTVPLISEEMIDDIRHLVGEHQEGSVFPGPEGRSLTVRMINHICRQAGERAGIKNPNPKLKYINPHIFRHSIARYLKSKGFSAEWIQNFLGHASYKTTMDMYGTISIDEMQEEAQRRLPSI